MSFEDNAPTLSEARLMVASEPDMRSTGLLALGRRHLKRALEAMDERDVSLAKDSAFHAHKALLAGIRQREDFVHGGKLRAKYKLTEAQARELLAAYQSTTDGTPQNRARQLDALRHVWSTTG